MSPEAVTADRIRSVLSSVLLWAVRIVVGYLLIGMIMAVGLVSNGPLTIPLHQVVLFYVLFWPIQVIWWLSGVD